MSYPSRIWSSSKYPLYSCNRIETCGVARPQALFLAVMVKEQFLIAGSREVLYQIDQAGQKAGVGRGQAFEDFLTFVRCSLAGQTMEDEYLSAVRKAYDKGKKGERGIDLIAKSFGRLIHLMEETGQDILGDIYQGGITFGERGQYFTPGSLADLMAAVTIGDDDGRDRKSVCDPACGSGRILLAIGRNHPHWNFIGQDVCHQCVQMTAINMGLRGLFGYAVWQNTLTLNVYRVYRVGFNLQGGVIREMPIEQSPFAYNRNDNQSGNTQTETIDGGNATVGFVLIAKEWCAISIDFNFELWNKYGTMWPILMPTSCTMLAILKSKSTVFTVT